MISLTGMVCVYTNYIMQLSWVFEITNLEYIYHGLSRKKEKLNDSLNKLNALGRDKMQIKILNTENQYQRYRMKSIGGSQENSWGVETWGGCDPAPGCQGTFSETQVQRDYAWL